MQLLFCVLFNQKNLSQQQTSPKVVNSSGYGTNTSSASRSADEEGEATRKKFVETITAADRSGTRNVGMDCAYTADTIILLTNVLLI